MCGASPLTLDTISYEGLVQAHPEAIAHLRKALYDKGIVGIRDIPGYREKVDALIERAREFTALPEEIKAQYAPKPGEMFLGYELGKEKFKLPDGAWIIDSQKASYYAYIPEQKENKWPAEVPLRDAFQEIGVLMRGMGILVMEKIGLTGADTGISVDKIPSVGRMLAYRGLAVESKNPLWCGAHFDHGLFTALLPSFYFLDGEPFEEPEEAGLYVRTKSGEEFRKIFADPGVMLFQVGEFGQLATNDAIRATEHRVQKSDNGRIERYTMANFFEAPMDTELRSTSQLTADSRYGGNTGDPCTYREWHEASFKRYIVE